MARSLRQAAAAAASAKPRRVPANCAGRPRGTGQAREELDTAKGKAKDPATVAHLGDLEAEIKAILADEKK